MANMREYVRIKPRNVRSETLPFSGRGIFISGAVSHAASRRISRPGKFTSWAYSLSSFLPFSGGLLDS